MRVIKRKQPKAFVVSGPSGVGKGTVINEMLLQRPSLGVATSATTRSQRDGEVNGKDYFFLSETEFDKKIDDLAFVEWCLVHGNKYGTLTEEVKKYIDDNRHVILEIDVQGAQKVINAYKNGQFEGQFDIVSIFIEPPSVSELTSRLKGRNTESESEQKRRMEVAKTELEQKGFYDFRVINEDKVLAASEILGIINSFE